MWISKKLCSFILLFYSAQKSDQEYIKFFKMKTSVTKQTPFRRSGKLQIHLIAAGRQGRRPESDLVPAQQKTAEDRQTRCDFHCPCTSHWFSADLLFPCSVAQFFRQCKGKKKIRQFCPKRILYTGQTDVKWLGVYRGTLRRIRGRGWEPPPSH